MLVTYGSGVHSLCSGSKFRIPSAFANALRSATADKGSGLNFKLQTSNLPFPLGAGATRVLLVIPGPFFSSFRAPTRNPEIIHININRDEGDERDGYKRKKPILKVLIFSVYLFYFRLPDFIPFIPFIPVK
jgi:hypothetical protein